MAHRKRGTGLASTAPATLTALGAAASGANSDITSLAGLSTPLSVIQGGNGLSTAALGDLRYGSGANTLAALSGNTKLLRKFLSEKGDGSLSAAPAWFPMVIGADCSAHAVSSGTSETILKTFSFTAADIPIVADSIIVVHTLWTLTNSGNNKTLRIRIGTAGAGTAGTAYLNTVQTTNTIVARDAYIFVRGTSSQVGFAQGNTAHEGVGTGAMITSAVDLTANWEIALTGTTASSGETIQLESAMVRVLIP